MSMGQNIRTLRVKQRMSQSELARESGIARQTIACIESGTARSVRTGTLEAIAKALGVSVQVFFAESVS